MTGDPTMGRKTFYLFRHGETYFSKNEIPYGTNERTAEILPEALKPTQKLADYLRTKSIEYAARSEYLRCEQTATIIEAEIGLHFEPNNQLNELHETDFNQFIDRMKNLSDMLLGLQAQHIAICTHGANVAALKKLLCQQPFHAKDLAFYPKTGVIVRIEEGTITEVDFNV